MARAMSEVGLLAKAYARKHGCSVQWARRLAKAGDKRFLDFAAASRTGSAPVPASAPMTALEKAQRMRETAWRAYDLAREAMVSPDADVAARAVLQRSLMLAGESVARAEKRAHELEVQAQRWVSIDNVRGIRQSMRLLEEHVQNWRMLIASHLPTEHRDEFYAAFDATRENWNEGILRISRYVDSLLPQPYDSELCSGPC